MVCGAHLFVLSIDAQVCLKLVATAAVAVVERKDTKFAQRNVVWGGFPWDRSSGSQSFILVDALFLLDGGRRREGSRPTLLAVQHSC
jgi:hypothetical protein